MSRVLTPLAGLFVWTCWRLGHLPLPLPLRLRLWRTLVALVLWQAQQAPHPEARTMPDPLTRIDLDAALAEAARQQANAVIEAHCPAHPDDGCLLLERDPGVVEVQCFTCLASVARLAVATPPVALAFGTCRVHGSVGCRVRYAGQGVVEAVCWTCARVVVSLPLG